jgi:hypothetical protein
MAKKVLVFGLSFFLIASLNVFGAEKSKDKKMDELPGKMENANYPNESIISNYLLTPEPDIFYPASNDTVGYTYHDYQHNDTQRRQIASGPDGRLHFSWMNLIGPDLITTRHIDYNSYKTNWLNYGGIHITPAAARAGYCGLDLLPDGREVLFYHRSQPTTPNTYWGTTISIEKSTPGLGEFNAFDIPDSCAGTTYKGQWPSLAISKQMIADTVFMHITHAEGKTSGAVDKRLEYVRCFEKPGNSDTLVCESPGWGSPLQIPKDTKLAPNKVPYSFATARLGGTAVATSPVSQKTAVIWLQNTTSSQTQNEVMYMESIDNGDDWIASGTMTPVQITDYAAGGYQYSAIWDLAAAYDYNDELHIVWTTYRDSYFKDVSLWHWSSSTGIVKVRSAITSSTIGPGTYNLIISKFTLGVGYNPLDSAYNYLYLTYTEFKNGDKSAGGYSNGDIYVQASSNGGLTWGPETNLTNTNSNGCTPGNCESEHWSSMAEKVDSFLYVQYIYDLDAGGIPYDEGTYTFNPVRYLKYPRFLVQPIAAMSYSPTQMVSPIRWTTNGGTSSDSLVVYNESGTAALYVKLSGPSWLNISPANFSISAYQKQDLPKLLI